MGKILYDNNGNELRYRIFSGILYPDSCDIEEFLDDPRVGEYALSPLHDQDVWTAKDEKKDPKHVAGTPKKAHYHVMITYQGKQKMSTMNALFKEYNQQEPEVCSRRVGLYRYFTHMDNPEKAQYDEAQIKHSPDFDVDACMSKSQLKKKEDIEEVSRYRTVKELIDKKDIDEIFVLLDLLIDTDPDLFLYVKRNIHIFDIYTRSRRNFEKDNFKKTEKDYQQRIQELHEALEAVLTADDVTEEIEQRVSDALSKYNKETKKEDEDNVNSHQTD